MTSDSALGCDDILSDFSDDCDNPYQETAFDWWSRDTQRRRRRQCGIANSSSDYSSIDSDDFFIELIDADLGRINNGWESTKSNSMDLKIIKLELARYRAVSNWFQTYPLVAARCCLSLPSKEVAVPNSATSYDQYQSENSHLVHECTYHESKRFHRRLHRISKRILELQSSVRTGLVDTEDVKNDRLAIDSILPRGFGISFIDAVLHKRFHLSAEKQISVNEKQNRTSCRLVLELNGPARSGMTSILLAIAARYVASTSKIFFEIDNNCNAEKDIKISTIIPSDAVNYDENLIIRQSLHPNKRHENGKADLLYQINTPTEPIVVLFDLEHGIHPVKLMLSVREAVLRRWEETSVAREWIYKQTKQCTSSHEGKQDHNVEDGNIRMKNDSKDVSETKEDQRRIEKSIASCLGRIHIVKPRDFTHLSLVATLESLRQSLDKRKIQKNQYFKMINEQSQKFINRNQWKLSCMDVSSQEPPSLILIDSLSTLDASTKFQESLSTVSGSKSSGSGLSERNEFFRQLRRLREAHEIAIFGAVKSSPSADKLSGVGTSLGGTERVRNPWTKLVTRRVTLHHVALGTIEDRDGYDFVATLNSQSMLKNTPMFPYSVTAGGILCA